MRVGGNKPGLTAFIHNVPGDSHALVLKYLSATAGETLLALDAKKVAGQDSSEMAEHLMNQCADWAESSGGECAFMAQWVDAQQEPLATHKWRAGSQDSAVPFNGTAESILAQQQGHNHVIMKLFVDSLEPAMRMYRDNNEYLANRVKTLEKKLFGLEGEVEAAREVQAIIEDPDAERQERRWEKFMEMSERLVFGVLASGDDDDDDDGDKKKKKKANGNGAEEKKAAGAEEKKAAGAEEKKAAGNGSKKKRASARRGSDDADDATVEDAPPPADAKDAKASDAAAPDASAT